VAVDALEKLRRRGGELADLAGLEMLAQWDQRVMMPADGAPARAQQLGTLARLTHERATAEEIGGGVAALAGGGAGGGGRGVVGPGRGGGGGGPPRAGGAG